MGRVLLASVAAALLCVQSLPAFAQYTVDTWLDYDGTSLQRYSETSGGVYDEQCHWEPWDGADFPIDLWVCSGQETIEFRVDTWLYAPGGAPVLALSDVDPDFASVGYLYGPGTNYGTWTAVAEHHARERWYQETCFPPGFTPPPPLQQCQGFVIIWDENLGTTMDEVDVLPPPCGTGAQNARAINDLLYDWLPHQEPFERSARMRCVNNQVFLDAHSDSFGDIFPNGPGTSNDPCSVGTPLAFSIAGVHSHPYFDTVAQYNAGDGCLGEYNWVITLQQLHILNTVTNLDFSDDDESWVIESGLPLYMRNPIVGPAPFPYAGAIQRLELNLTRTHVWP